MGPDFPGRKQGNQMKTKRALLQIALLASAAIGPLFFSEAAMAQGAPGAGSFPGSFLVPGTQTSFKVGGYIKFDYTYDFGPQTNINGGASPLGVVFDSKMLCTPFRDCDADPDDHRNLLADS